MTDCSKADQPFHSRPLIGKLKFVLAKVQSQYAKLPEDQRHGNPTRVKLLNVELEKYHLRCDDWSTFAHFVGFSGVDSKSVSHLLRYARRQSRGGKSINLYTFSIEDIQRAVVWKVPFRLLQPHWKHRVDMSPTDIGYEYQLKMEREGRAKRWKAISAQSELVKYCEARGIKVPMR